MAGFLIILVSGFASHFWPCKCLKFYPDSCWNTFADIEKNFGTLRSEILSGYDKTRLTTSHAVTTKTITTLRACVQLELLLLVISHFWPTSEKLFYFRHFPGNPGKVWVERCPSEALIYPQILALDAYLTGLMQLLKIPPWGIFGLIEKTKVTQHFYWLVLFLQQNVFQPKNGKKCQICLGEIYFHDVFGPLVDPDLSLFLAGKIASELIWSNLLNKIPQKNLGDSFIGLVSSDSWRGGNWIIHSILVKCWLFSPKIPLFLLKLVNTYVDKFKVAERMALCSETDGRVGLKNRKGYSERRRR